MEDWVTLIAADVQPVPVCRGKPLKILPAAGSVHPGVRGDSWVRCHVWAFRAHAVRIVPILFPRATLLDARYARSETVHPGVTAHCPPDTAHTALLPCRRSRHVRCFAQACAERRTHRPIVRPMRLTRTRAHPIFSSRGCTEGAEMDGLLRVNTLRGSCAGCRQ